MAVAEDVTRRSAVVTGGGSGLGAQLVVSLARRGYAVFGTVMSDDEAAAVRDASAGLATMIACDITNEHDVDRLVATVKAACPAGLDLLFSNAATITPGPLEVLPLDAVRREFDVNVFGGLRVITAMLPLLRQARPRPRIVHIGSRTADMPTAFNGVCSATKAAMAALADVYRAELHTSGIDVTVAVPGSIKTRGLEGMPDRLDQVRHSMSAQQQECYAAGLDAFTHAVRTGPATATSARECAQRIVDVAEQVPAPVRVAIGLDAERALADAVSLTDAQLARRRLDAVGLT